MAKYGVVNRTEEPTGIEVARSDAEALPGWIGVVARNKMLDLIRRAGSPGAAVSFESVVETLACTDEDGLAAGETFRAMERAVRQLSTREQAVLRGRVFTASPEPLRRIGERLDIPSGSIGPTLGRGLSKLRANRELMDYLSVDGRPLAHRAAA